MLKNSTKNYWDKYWISDTHQPQVVHEELINNLLKYVDVKDKKIMEIGAGMAGDSFLLAKKGAKVFILDFSSEALKIINSASKKEQVEIQTVLADAQKIPFPDETFDVIFHQGFIEHYRNPKLYLMEQRRVLKKGGILIVDVPQKYTTYTIKKHIKIWMGEWFAGWETQYSIGQLEKLVKSLGLKLINSYGWGYYGKLNKIRNLPLGNWYDQLWRKIESSRLYLYLTFSIGVVAQKERSC